MALISETIPNLVNGVSQQPATMRLASQAEAQENAYSSVVEGLKKRPPTQFIKKIISGTLADAFIHTINRDTTERYIVILTDNGIRVFDLAGVEKTVNTPNGTGYLDITGLPSETFRCITIADYTFIVSKEKTVAMDAATTTAAQSRALIYVRQGNYATDYKIFVGGVEKATYTTSSTDITTLKTEGIAEDLRADLVTSLGAGWTVARQGSTISIKKDDGASFECKATDSNGDKNIVLVRDSIQRFTDLPSVAPTDYVVHILGDLTTEADDYYVKFVPLNAGATFDRGYWIETVKPGITYKLDATTMPHTLVRNGDGTFTFDRATWGQRVCGDTTSAPNPSFVGQKLNDVFFFKNRLGFLSDENYILSRSGGAYFDFFRETTTAILDSDPVDAAVSHTKVSILRSAVQSSKKLYLYADQTQFEVDGSDLLTPKTVSSNVSTEFENSKMCRPISVGKNVYFIVQKGSYSGLREYYVDDSTATADAANVTAHVPAYLPSGIYKITAATNEDVLVMFSSTERASAWVYKYYWNGDEKLQSSWSKWTFGNGILNGDFIDTDLYLVVQRADGVYIEKMSVEPFRQDTGFTYEILLDRKIKDTDCTSVVYDAANDWTTWTLPYDEAGTLKVVTRSGGAKKLGIAVTHTRPANTTVRAVGDWTAQPVFIGKTYLGSYEFSEPVLKSSRGEGKGESPVTGGRLQILRYRLAFDRTGYFKVRVILTDGQTWEYKFTGKVLGSGSTLIGVSGLESGLFNFPVRSKSNRFRAIIESDSFMPFHIQSAEWEAQFVMRAQRA